MSERAFAALARADAALAQPRAEGKPWELPAPMDVGAPAPVSRRPPAPGNTVSAPEVRAMIDGIRDGIRRLFAVRDERITELAVRITALEEALTEPRQ